jgi:hypothetical protein
VNLLALPLDRFCNAIFAWAVQHADDPVQWVQQLEAPIPGEKADPDAYKDDLKSFMAVQGAVQTG